MCPTMPMDVSVGEFPLMVAGVSYHASGYKCWSLSRMVVGVSYHADDISIEEEDLHGGIQPT